MAKEWGKAWSQCKTAVREFIGLRLIWWGLLVLPNQRLKAAIAMTMAEAVAVEINDFKGVI